ncbi:MAG: hypothetical protein LQ340_003670 [Diploschistes diacapsis]|nr:MAG: hypothetical protein LQ340_003670 [Diploschistes diacapsis]
MNSHPNPQNVLVIGGGDGGVLREVVKHPSVTSAVICEIDEAVIRVSKKYLPAMSIGFHHPNVHTHIGDGFEYLRRSEKKFDVIITDSSDPKGPAESLFRKQYFELLASALSDGGVIATQGDQHYFSPALPLSLLRSTSEERALIRQAIAENQWLHLPLITSLRKSCLELFPKVEYAFTTIPTYPSGQIGFLICCNDPKRNLREPLRSWSEEEEERLCRYYNRAVHGAAFVLPSFVRNALK